MKSDKHLLMLLFAIYLFAIVVVVVGAGSEFVTTALKSGGNEAWLGCAVSRGIRRPGDAGNFVSRHKAGFGSGRIRGHR